MMNSRLIAWQPYRRSHRSWIPSNRWSTTHITIDDDKTTLCGRKIPPPERAFSYEHGAAAANGDRCQRCEAAAKKRGIEIPHTSRYLSPPLNEDAK